MTKQIDYQELYLMLDMAITEVTIDLSHYRKIPQCAEIFSILEEAQTKANKIFFDNFDKSQMKTFHCHRQKKPSQD